MNDLLWTIGLTIPYWRLVERLKHNVCFLFHVIWAEENQKNGANM